MKLYEKLKTALRKKIENHNFSEDNISVRCKALDAKEAIGEPEHDDYPIIKGKEVMVEAIFKGARGQAFSDRFENADYSIKDLLKIETDSNQKRASFISGLNAVFRYLGLCDKTIHCKDKEPEICADNLAKVIPSGKKILLVGYQPRFLEKLAQHYDMRVVDADEENIGKKVSGVAILPLEATSDSLKWCDFIFATGSTLVNGTITDFLKQSKPALFYGVTIAAAANILNLKSYCHCGR